MHNDYKIVYKIIHKIILNIKKKYDNLRASPSVVYNFVLCKIYTTCKKIYLQQSFKNEFCLK